jgi:hypothetical protein
MAAVMNDVRLLAVELSINRHAVSWRESASDWEWSLFDDLSSLVDWLDFQSYSGGQFGPREFRAVTRGHVLLPADLAGGFGAYLAPDVLADGLWRWHAPRVFVSRSRSARPVLRVC